MNVYFVLDADGYPESSSLEPLEGAQVEDVAAVAERAADYHRRGRPPRHERDDPAPDPPRPPRRPR